MDIRDRVVELRKVPANELLENPKNWRKHPPSQKSAMSAALSEIGLADAVIARETPDGLQLIDGHLRQEMLGDTPVPVLIVDLTAEEADKLLLTLDPMAAMASTDTDALLALLEQTKVNSSALNDMLEGLANGERYPMPDLTIMPESSTDAFYLPNEHVEDAERRDERDASGVAPTRNVVLIVDDAVYPDFVQAVKAFGERHGLDNVSDIVVQGMIYASSS